RGSRQRGPAGARDTVPAARAGPERPRGVGVPPDLPAGPTLAPSRPPESLTGPWRVAKRRPASVRQPPLFDRQTLRPGRKTIISTAQRVAEADGAEEAVRGAEGAGPGAINPGSEVERV